MLKNINVKAAKYEDISKPDDLEWFDQGKEEKLDIDFALYLSEWNDARTICYSSSEAKKELETNISINSLSRVIQHYEGEQRKFDYLRIGMSKVDFIGSGLLSSLINQDFPMVMVMDQDDLIEFFVGIGYQKFDSRVVSASTFTLLTHPKNENREFKLDPDLILEKVQLNLDQRKYKKAYELLGKVRNLELSKPQQISLERLNIICAWYVGEKEKGRNSCDWLYENVTEEDFESKETHDAFIEMVDRNLLFYLPKLGCAPSYNGYDNLAFIMEATLVRGSVTPVLTKTDEGFSVTTSSYVAEGEWIKITHHLNPDLSWASAVGDLTRITTETWSPNVEMKINDLGMFPIIDGIEHKQPAEICVPLFDGQYLTSLNPITILTKSGKLVIGEEIGLAGYTRATNSVILDKIIHFIARKGDVYRFVSYDGSDFKAGVTFTLPDSDPHSILLHNDTLFVAYKGDSNFRIRTTEKFSELVPSLYTKL
jgi:hypothetical protein